MSENLSTNVELDSTANGTVSFATDVVATIAGLAATEVEGVAAMINTGNGLVDMLRKNQGNKPLTRGVKIDISGNQVTVQLTINVDYGSPVPTVAREIQDNVKKAIETMTGLEVSSINIYVQGISFEKENKAAAELEQKKHAALTEKKVERLGRGEDEARADGKPDAEEPARHIFRPFARRQPDVKPDEAAPADKSVAADEPEQPSEPPVSAAQPAEAQPAPEEAVAPAQPEDDAPVTEEAPATEADDDDDEGVCDGHCETCTLECEAAGKHDDEAEDAPQQCEFECESGMECPDADKCAANGSAAEGNAEEDMGKPE